MTGIQIKIGTLLANQINSFAQADRGNLGFPYLNYGFLLFKGVPHYKEPQMDSLGPITTALVSKGDVTEASGSRRRTPRPSQDESKEIAVQMKRIESKVDFLCDYHQALGQLLVSGHRFDACELPKYQGG